MEKTKNNRDKKNIRIAHVNASNLVYGKLPPNAKDLEELVLGVIMLEPGSIDRALEYISADAFYSPANQEIFRCMHTLHQKSQPTDILMVVEELKNQKKLEEVGGPYYVTRL